MGENELVDAADVDIDAGVDVDVVDDMGLLAWALWEVKLVVCMLNESDSG